MELALNDIQFENFKFNVSLNSKELIGITGKNIKDLVTFFENPTNYKGKISIQNTQITNSNKFLYNERVTVIPESPSFPLFTETILDYLLYEIRTKDVETKDDLRKINNSLKIVGLDLSYKNRNLITLSNCEKKLVQIAAKLLTNPDIIILDEPFTYFDLNYQKRILMLLERMQDQYKKVIIIITNNSNYIYKYTKRAIIVKNGQILLDGPTKDIYERVSYLKKNGLEIPYIVEFTNRAKKEKKVRIEYHKDIRDLIKDIYKHV